MRLRMFLVGIKNAGLEMSPLVNRTKSVFLSISIFAVIERQGAGVGAFVATSVGLS
jgi:hypothetical protein